ncbi:hypothetical protein [Moraxella lacunata]|uniref:hypothetical protein n=1 Tax=Moraxella lacunata TaxID=477 RepID=UPI003EE05351
MVWHSHQSLNVVSFFVFMQDFCLSAFWLPFLAIFSCRRLTSNACNLTESRLPRLLFT